MRLTGIALCQWSVAWVLTSAASAVTYNVGEEPSFATAVLVEASTGTVLFEHEADAPRSPASTQKLLLQLVVMDAVAEGRYDMSDSVYTSAWASRMGGSQVFLKQGEVFPLSELMAAIVISSANDACVAVAEHMGGSVEGFVELMNAKARELDLPSTRCVNVHGLDDTPSDAGNVTTARDLSTVALSLLDHPQILEWSSIRIRPFRGGAFTLYTTNKLLGRFRGLDGLKTGYTQRAGSCLVATAERGGMRLISVIMGGRGEKARDRETARLLSWGFNHFVKGPLAIAGEQVGAVPLDWGREPEVAAVTADTVIAVLTPEQRRRVQRDIDLPELQPAPISAGDTLGVLRLRLDDSVLAQVELVAADSVGRMSVWEKLMSYF
jgi:D-alanyl-D-alanine carboxypeptidase (penicillin-binding protein 5/6)